MEGNPVASIVADMKNSDEIDSEDSDGVVSEDDEDLTGESDDEAVATINQIRREHLAKINSRGRAQGARGRRVNVSQKRKFESVKTFQNFTKKLKKDTGITIRSLKGDSVLDLGDLLYSESDNYSDTSDGLSEPEFEVNPNAALELNDGDESYIDPLTGDFVVPEKKPLKPPEMMLPKLEENLTTVEEPIQKTLSLSDIIDDKDLNLPLNIKVSEIEEAGINAEILIPEHSMKKEECVGVNKNVIKEEPKEELDNDAKPTQPSTEKPKIEQDNDVKPILPSGEKPKEAEEEKKPGNALNVRRNIRDLIDEKHLDASTLAAQREESERLARVQEQQRLIREVQKQIAINKQNKIQERNLALLQGTGASLLKRPGQKVNLSNTVLVKLPSGEMKRMMKPGHSEMMKLNSIAMAQKKLLKSDEKVVEISSSEGEDSGGSGEEEEEEEGESSSSESDDCIMLSDSEVPASPEAVEEDPNNSGLHVNDTYNVPDDQGRVLINIGHPEKEEDIFLAPQIARIIKPHQIGGVRFLYDNIIESVERFTTSTGFGCILAHSMGLGKTLQIVCFTDIFLRHTPAKTVLCIMPINTLQNWVAEFNMWLPTDINASPLTIYGDVRARHFPIYVLNDSHKTLAMRAKVVRDWKTTGGVLMIGYELYRLLSMKKDKKPRRKKKSEIKAELAAKAKEAQENAQKVQDKSGEGEMKNKPSENGNTSSNTIDGPQTESGKLDKDIKKDDEPVDEDKKMLDEMFEALVKPGPDLVICDEGHRIKNSHSNISYALKQMRTKRRIVLTGYPLQNNLLEYWCMVDFVRPNYLGTKTEFCNMFERPIQNGQCIDSTPQDIRLMRYRAHVLHSLLVGFVQRRSHAVLQSTLPQKEEYVLLIRMTPLQRKLYETFMNEIVRTKKVPNPLKAFAICCKIWNHPDVLYMFLKKRAESNLAVEMDLDLEEVVGNSKLQKSMCKPTRVRNVKGAAKKPAATIQPNTSGSNSRQDMTQPNQQNPHFNNQPNQYPPFPSQNPGQYPPQGEGYQGYNQNYPQQQYNYNPHQAPANYPGYNNQQNYWNNEGYYGNQGYYNQQYQGQQAPPYNGPPHQGPDGAPQYPYVKQENQQYNQFDHSSQNAIQPYYGTNQQPYPHNGSGGYPTGFPQNTYPNTQQNPLPNNQPPLDYPPPTQTNVSPHDPYNTQSNSSYNQAQPVQSQNPANYQPNAQQPPQPLNSGPDATYPPNQYQHQSYPYQPPNPNYPQNQSAPNYNQPFGAPPYQNQPGYPEYQDPNFPNSQGPNYSSGENSAARAPYPPNGSNYNYEQNQAPYSDSRGVVDSNFDQVKSEPLESKPCDQIQNETNHNGFPSAIPGYLNSPMQTKSPSGSADIPLSIANAIKTDEEKVKIEKMEIKSESDSEVKIEDLDTKAIVNKDGNQIESAQKPQEESKEIDASKKPLKKDSPKTKTPKKAGPKSKTKKDESDSNDSDKDQKKDKEEEAALAKKAEEMTYDWATELLRNYVSGVIENSAKMELFFMLLNESVVMGDRMLLFSQSLFTLNLIEDFLERNIIPGTNSYWARNTSYFRLDGSTHALEREKLINEFNSNTKVHLFLVSTRAGSLGINLVGANRVIVFDASWNPCHDTQAVCRVYRYGQQKPCFVYRFVMDCCLEKKIYDRQINKQGMADRIVDECNPDAVLSMKEITNLCWDADDKESEPKELSESRDKYGDTLMQSIVCNHWKLLSKEPFQHESLLVDRKEKKLSSAEKRLAKRGYELEKKAASAPKPLSGRARPVGTVRPMQHAARWIPAEVWRRQGMTAQEMTLPLDVVIPTNSAEKANIVLKAGQRVMVLKSPKGIYMQLESGKIIAIKTAFKPGQKPGEKESNTSITKRVIGVRPTGPSMPGALKNNSAITISKSIIRPGLQRVIPRAGMQGRLNVRPFLNKGMRPMLAGRNQQMYRGKFPPGRTIRPPLVKNDKPVSDQGAETHVLDSDDEQNGNKQDVKTMKGEDKGLGDPKESCYETSNSASSESKTENKISEESNPSKSEPAETNQTNMKTEDTLSLDSKPAAEGKSVSLTTDEAFPTEAALDVGKRPGSLLATLKKYRHKPIRPPGADNELSRLEKAVTSSSVDFRRGLDDITAPQEVEKPGPKSRKKKPLPTQFQPQSYSDGSNSAYNQSVSAPVSPALPPQMKSGIMPHPGMPQTNLIPSPEAVNFSPTANVAPMMSYGSPGIPLPPSGMPTHQPPGYHGYPVRPPYPYFNQGYPPNVYPPSEAPMYDHQQPPQQW